MRDLLGFNLHPSDEDYAPLAAGQLTHGATVREMTSGFTMFPNSGERVELRTYSRVYDHLGNILIDNTVRSYRVINETTAFWMTDMLHDAVVSGTGGSANLGRRMPTAGKTGTSTDSKDRWFVGFTPYYIAAVWTGFDTPAPMRSSGNPAAQIWKLIMEPIHQDLETRQWRRPDYIPPPRRPTGGVVTSTYTIRLMDTNGATILEEQVVAVVGRELIVAAPYQMYYNIVGETEKEITITNDPARNFLTFTYHWVGPDEPDEPDEPDYPDYPDYPDEPYPPDDPDIIDDPYHPDWPGPLPTTPPPDPPDDETDTSDNS